MKRAPRTARNPLFAILLGIGVLVFGSLLAVVTWFWQTWSSDLVRHARDAPAGDPRNTFPTPYRNVRPEVRYVGDKTCALCHAGLAESFHRHPMGRSLAPISDAGSVERYDQAARNPFEKDGFQFLIERQEGHVFHREFCQNSQGLPVPLQSVEVHYAIGSGARGRSYLINRDGYVFQSLLSWYTQPGAWDLTPGFQVPEQFERPAEPSCLFCHANQVEPITNTINRYRQPLFRGYAIGCERCHGPGELHVQAQQAGNAAANTIVNPGRLSPALRDAVCQQCHLQGESRILRRGRQQFDYRPGLPLNLFWSVFVRSSDLADSESAGSHTEQVYVSRCFQQSQGRLGCISCHDPHVLPESDHRAEHYRRRCLTCHEKQGCTQVVSLRSATVPADNCVQCHMARTGSRIVHRAVTDHRIRRKPDADGRPQDSPRRLFPGEIPLVLFPGDKRGPEDDGIAHDLGLALAELAKTYPPLSAHVNPIALPRLEAAVRTAPDDVPAWEAYGLVLWQMDRKSDALGAFEAALALSPEREITLTYLGVLTAALARREEAIAYWQRAIAVNPWCSAYHFRLAGLLAARPNWPQALAESEAASALNPAAPEMRRLLITCLLRTGQEVRARRELDMLLSIRPREREQLREWFSGQIRR
ncbi:MAG TPA: tetratricopeptide repeat protein [Gemmataceae bacterium]|nr:tetratricopeptide repeat protein [Gemmataceae bacterium]